MKATRQRLTENLGSKPSKPQKLTKEHDRTSFESGAAELDEWLRKYSWQNMRANNATMYVTTAGDGRVVGYYTITVAGYERGAAPELIAKRAPETVPCFLLARLAVDLDWHGCGLGWGLLRDSMQRALLLCESITAPALLVHARDDEARAFYCHHAEFLQSPLDPLHLFLPMKAIASRLQNVSDEAAEAS